MSNHSTQSHQKSDPWSKLAMSSKGAPNKIVYHGYVIGPLMNYVIYYLAWLRLKLNTKISLHTHRHQPTQSFLWFLGSLRNYSNPPPHREDLVKRLSNMNTFDLSLMHGRGGQVWLEGSIEIWPYSSKLAIENINERNFRK